MCHNKILPCCLLIALKVVLRRLSVPKARDSDETKSWVKVAAVLAGRGRTALADVRLPLEQVPWRQKKLHTG